MRRPDPRQTCFALRHGWHALLAAALAACAPLPPAEGPLRPWQVAELERQAARLHRSDLAVRDPILSAWIVERLRRIDPDHGPMLQVFLLDEPTTQADLVGGRLLRLRTGLLRELHDEPELIFVLAHEVAHRRLGHVAAREAPDWDPIAAEIEADLDAVRTLVAMGIGPDTGRALLQRLALRLDRARDRATIQRRIEALALAAQPAATVDAPYPEDPDRFARLIAPYR